MKKLWDKVFGAKIVPVIDTATSAVSSTDPITRLDLRELARKKDAKARWMEASMIMGRVSMTASVPTIYGCKVYREYGPSTRTLRACVEDPRPTYPFHALESYLKTGLPDGSTVEITTRYSPFSPHTTSGPTSLGGTKEMWSSTFQDTTSRTGLEISEKLSTIWNSYLRRTMEMTEAPKYTYEDFIKVSEELKKEGYTDEQIAQAVDAYLLHQTIEAVGGESGPFAKLITALASSGMTGAKILTPSSAGPTKAKAKPGKFKVYMRRTQVEVEDIHTGKMIPKGTMCYYWQRSGRTPTSWTSHPIPYRSLTMPAGGYL